MLLIRLWCLQSSQSTLCRKLQKCFCCNELREGMGDAPLNSEKWHKISVTKGRKYGSEMQKKRCVLVNTLMFLFFKYIHPPSLTKDSVWSVERATWLCSGPVVLFLCLHSDHRFLDWVVVYSLENDKRGRWESKWTTNQSKKCEKPMFVSSLWHKVMALPDVKGRSCLLKFQGSDQRKKKESQYLAYFSA